MILGLSPIPIAGAEKQQDGVGGQLACSEQGAVHTVDLKRQSSVGMTVLKPSYWAMELDAADRTQGTIVGSFKVVSIIVGIVATLAGVAAFLR